MTVNAVSKNGMVKVEWVDLGEGKCGDYDPTDPDDVALLRWDAYVKWTGTPMDEIRGLEPEFDTGWAYCDHSSFCTLTEAGTDEVVLFDLAQLIADELADNLDNGGWKSCAEEMSYAHPGWLDRKRRVDDGATV